jgi:phosphoglycerate-specific signal transduction histidine kinase
MYGRRKTTRITFSESMALAVLLQRKNRLLQQISQANSATVQAYRRVAPSFLSLGGSAFDFGLKVPIPN